MKKFLIVSLIFLSVMTSAYKKPDVYVIDAQKNAYIHNNLGLTYVDEKCYYAAIQEFKIAISLNPNTQATAVYYNNLGEVYLTIGYPDFALDCFERALTQFSLNFKYYQNLAKTFKLLGTLDEKIAKYSDESNPLNKVMLGLLYEQKGDTKRAITILDDFVMSEPDLIITPSVKKHIKDLVEAQ
ncbi:tetratricopeptide repeat protein [bacterium]|nr:tetratricopeptide repeat protein [bacterium]